MNNKLWIFGDSFAEIRPGASTWGLQVANNYKLDLANIAVNGCGVDWLSLQWSEIFHTIDVNDRIVVLAPFPDRVNFWHDRPSLSGYSALIKLETDQTLQKKLDGVPAEAISAFKEYFKWLHNPIYNNLKITGWLHWVNSVGKNLKNKPVVLHTTNQTVNSPLDYSIVAQGNLLDATIAEFKSIGEWERLTATGAWQDTRISHFSTQNHVVLANKIIKSWDEDTVIDLTTGWHAGII